MNGTNGHAAPELDYLRHLAADSDRFGTLLAGADPLLRVPSCTDWAADDLLWHLTEVQWFWWEILRGRLQQPDAAESATPERPADRARLPALFHQASTGLHTCLSQTDPDEPVWTWADDQSVRFVRRRQAHEAMVHRVDAEQTVGVASVLDPALAADGVDEALRVMYGGAPPWGEITDDGPTVRVAALDTGHTWLVVMARFTGTSPNTGKTYDEPTLHVLDDASVAGPDADCTVEGAAADLDLWLWGRKSTDDLDITGDRAAFERLEQAVAAGVQ
ncbi:MAG: maleylpyruvate isomerase family mycothiol-dependent enzyme [Actinomycetes bacterium]